MSFTDYLHLNEQKLFKTLRETLPPNIKKTQNLLAIKEGVVYTWNFQDGCVLTFNLKAARNKEAEDVICQTLLHTSPPLFTPETVLVNDAETLLIVAGPCGVLVLELPQKTPPYGAFANNKEVIYCRSHSLDERLLACSEFVELRQVRFHPGSPDNTHIVVLTSDNVIRLYRVLDNSAVSLGAYQIGEKPMGVIPGSKTTYLSAYGEIGVDFDFGPAELKKDETVNKKSLLQKTPLPSGLKAIEDSSSVALSKFDHLQGLKLKGSRDDLCWPIYILRGDGLVFTVTLDLDNPKIKPDVKGPIPMPLCDKIDCINDACSIICIPSTPPIVCIAMTNGTIYHNIVLPITDEEAVTFHNNNANINQLPDRTFYTFETVELELGLSLSLAQPEYSCPIFLHKDEAKTGRYFATHEAGVHSILIQATDDLQKFLKEPEDSDPGVDFMIDGSFTEYLICTKTDSSKKINPVIGFSLYSYPTCVVAILGNGDVVSLTILTTVLMPNFDASNLEDVENINSPLKKMLKEPFDVYIQKILNQGSKQPILKLLSEKESPELLFQRVSQVFREDYFKCHNKAREEIEKRIKTLQLLKKYQLNEIQRMKQEKQTLQEKAENLAEKYEDIKDKQDELCKRCEKALILVSQKKEEPSEAEKNFIKELREVEEKIQIYTKAINKVRMKQKYQSVQMENWKKDNKNRNNYLSQVQSDAIKSNLQDMTTKIAQMRKDILEYCKVLNLK